MLRGQSAVAFASSVSSEAASSRCLLGLRRRLSPLLSFRGWTTTTACSPARLLDGLQSVLNAAARLICNRMKNDHVTPLLRDVLHWLPVPFRIEYKLCLLVFQSLHRAASEYLRDCCTATHSSASGLRLRSLERTDLRVRRMRTHFGDRAFWAAGPRCWNSLPPVICFADSVDSFKAKLKTHLFAKAYPMCLLVRRPCSCMAALLRHINCRNYYYYYY